MWRKTEVIFAEYILVFLKSDSSGCFVLMRPLDGAAALLMQYHQLTDQ